MSASGWVRFRHPLFWELLGESLGETSGESRDCGQNENRRNSYIYWRPRRESNPQPSDPKSDALSS